MGFESPPLWPGDVADVDDRRVLLSIFALAGSTLDQLVGRSARCCPGVAPFQMCMTA